MSIWNEEVQFFSLKQSRKLLLFSLPDRSSIIFASMYVRMYACLVLYVNQSSVRPLRSTTEVFVSVLKHVIQRCHVCHKFEYDSERTARTTTKKQSKSQVNKTIRITINLRNEENLKNNNYARNIPSPSKRLQIIELTEADSEELAYSYYNLTAFEKYGLSEEDFKLLVDTLNEGMKKYQEEQKSL